MAKVKYAHLREDWIDDMIWIQSMSRADLPHERSLTREEAMAFTFRDPDFDPKGTWVATTDSGPIGYAAAGVDSNRIRAGKNDGHLDVDLLPEYRGAGVEEELLNRCVSYLRHRGVAKALARGQATDKWKISLLESGSFRVFYRIYFLVREGRQPAPAAKLPDGFRIEERMFSDMSDDEITTFVQAHNKAFFDHLNSAPEDPQRIMQWRDTFPDPIRVANARTGEVIAGVCMSEESSTFNKERGTKVGWVNILGVRPEYRRRGLARALLVDGIDWILSRGMDTIYIGVISANEKALVLYLSLGFRTDKELICYELPLRQPPI